IPVAHVEAGLRSFDRAMPEEINRIVTDHVSDLLFTTEPSGTINLAHEGIDSGKVHFVGNPMIDSLYAHLERAQARQPWQQFGLEPGSYGVVTLHRPSNVDERAVAQELAYALEQIARDVPLIFPMHPRTRSRGAGVWQALAGVQIVEPLGYLDFLGLMAQASLVITDSGGIQEETTVLGVRCLTVRRNTERPVTLSAGTNRLVEPNACALVAAFHEPFDGTGRIPELWDGQAAGRIVAVLREFYAARVGQAVPGGAPPA
ncbi:MAG: UDP-N-acetyl glucosamine 2-epimerase, partial [Anaerolineae bacterium]|nr:UDP-N-acetyl glucosamine 2-epimerase [Anaerolineae bacterium]